MGRRHFRLGLVKNERLGLIQRKLEELLPVRKEARSPLFSSVAYRSNCKESSSSYLSGASKKSDIDRLLELLSRPGIWTSFAVLF